MKALLSFAIMWAANFAFVYLYNHCVRAGLNRLIRAVVDSFLMSLAAAITVVFGLLLAINILGIEL